MSKYRNKAPEKYRARDSPSATTPYLLSEFSSIPATYSNISGLDCNKGPESYLSGPTPSFRANMRKKMAFILLNSPNKALLLSEIKEAMRLLYNDFYLDNPDQLETDGKTIRHHLSKYPEFSTAGKPKAGTGRGQLWKCKPQDKLTKQGIPGLQAPGGVFQVQASVHSDDGTSPVSMVTTQVFEGGPTATASSPSPCPTLSALDLLFGPGEGYLDFSPPALSFSPFALSPPSSEETPITPPQSAFELQSQVWPQLIDFNWLVDEEGEYIPKEI